MAPTQSVLSKFLYNKRLQSSKSHASNSVVQVVSLTDDSAKAADGGSGADLELLGTTSVIHGIQEDVVPGGVNEGTVSGGGNDVEIFDSKLASLAHEAARAHRLGYEQNRQW